MNWRVKWLLIPAVVVFVLFIMPGEVRPLNVLIFLGLVAAGTWWQVSGSKRLEEYRDPSPVRTESKDDRERSEGPWTSKKKYRYPPGLEGKPRSEFSIEEQKFITNFWFWEKFRDACERAGLVKVVPNEDPDKPDRRIYPGVGGFGVEPTGVGVVLFSTNSGFRPSEIAAAQEALCQMIVGDSDISVEVQRQRVLFRLHSRSPLAETISADDVFGAAPKVNRRKVTTDDFMKAMEEEDRND
ncbi:hypothetical protein [Corynebacterium glyciniphilum]|uniref:hypothetical protein n=1 Tax=Corynebacterium glyciniphilum TaxID=1404244 RepID=UPI003DA0AF3A